MRFANNSITKQIQPDIGDTHAALYKKMKHVHIVDTTLRDGEQAPGVSFSPEQKLEIAGRLAMCGIPEIESGIPAMGVGEQQALRMLNQSGIPVRFTAWCRADRRDIDDALSCLFKAVHISLPGSTILLNTLNKNEEWLYQKLDELIPYARERFDFVSIGIQDASRSSMELLSSIACRCSRLRADRLRLADSVGFWTPSDVQKCVTAVVNSAPELTIGVHMHNDLGMAAANTITALQSGATDLDVTVNGIGERAGNAPLEQILMTIHTIADDYRHNLKTENLYDLCCKVADFAGRSIPPAQPLTGRDVFRHESGIHVHALLKNRESYEPFPASRVGRSGTLNIAVGKHSGSAGLQYILKQCGVELSRQEIATLLVRVRQAAEQKKRDLTVNELLELVSV